MTAQIIDLNEYRLKRFVKELTKFKVGKSSDELIAELDKNLGE